MTTRQRAMTTRKRAVITREGAVITRTYCDNQGREWNGNGFATPSQLLNFPKHAGNLSGQPGTSQDTDNHPKQPSFPTRSAARAVSPPPPDGQPSRVLLVPTHRLYRTRGNGTMAQYNYTLGPPHLSLLKFLVTLGGNWDIKFTSIYLPTLGTDTSETDRQTDRQDPQTRSQLIHSLPTGPRWTARLADSQTNGHLTNSSRLSSDRSETDSQTGKQTRQTDERTSSVLTQTLL